MKTCAKCGTGFTSRKKKAVLCVGCWTEEGDIGRSVSEYGRGGGRAIELHGILEDDYSETSGRR